MLNSAIALNIVLTAHKIPHKVAHVHVPYLVAEKEQEIFTEGGNVSNFFFPILVSHLNGSPFNICPFLILFNMVALWAVHPGENCFELVVKIVCSF